MKTKESYAWLKKLKRVPLTFSFSIFLPQGSILQVLQRRRTNQGKVMKQKRPQNHPEIQDNLINFFDKCEPRKMQCGDYPNPKDKGTFQFWCCLMFIPTRWERIDAVSLASFVFIRLADGKPERKLCLGNFPCQARKPYLINWKPSEWNIPYESMMWRYMQGENMQARDKTVLS